MTDQPDESRKAPLRDNLVRASFPGAELRDGADGAAPILHGHFAVFNQWTRIESMREGVFMERIAPGSFVKTLAESKPKITLNHGKDPDLGDKPIAVPERLEEDRTGAAYDAPLLDGVPPLVISGLRAGQYGSSFRFSVVKDEWDDRPTKSPYNPDGLPERTIREARVMEFGPVTYPAYGGATAGVRSMTDDYWEPALRVDGADASHSDDGSRSDPEPVQPLAAAAPVPEDRSPMVDENPKKTLTPDERVARITELNEAVEREATEFTGVMPAEAQARFEADKAELQRLIDDQHAYEQRLADVQRLRQQQPRREEGEVVRDFQVIRGGHDPFSFEDGRSRGGTVEDRLQGFRDDAMKIIEGYRFPDAIDRSASQDKIADLLDFHDSPDKELARRIKATGSPVYRRAFDKIIKARGETFGLTPEEQRGTALAVGVDATGGFTVPFAFDPTIIAIGSWSGAVNPYRRVARVVPIVGTDTWNAITATAVVATRTTEAAAAVEQGPTFAQPQYVVTRVQGQITASFEMFQDRNDLGAEMATLIQEAKDNEEESSMATGATAAANIGVGPVNGTSGAYTSITTAASVTLAAADADAVEAALPVRHRFGAQWFLNRLSIRRFQTLETAGGKLFGGQQYQAVGIPEIDRAGNTGLRLLGYAVNESPSLPTAQTANIVIGTLLAPQSYIIVDRIGMSVQFIPFIFNSSALATGQQALYFLYRNTAKPINVDAGRTLRYLT
jgi:hypothetical protein